MAPAISTSNASVYMNKAKTASGAIAAALKLRLVAPPVEAACRRPGPVADGVLEAASAEEGATDVLKRE